jgi:hypothetical protein
VDLPHNGLSPYDSLGTREGAFCFVWRSGRGVDPRKTVHSELDRSESEGSRGSKSTDKVSLLSGHRQQRKGDFVTPPGILCKIHICMKIWILH